MEIKHKITGKVIHSDAYLTGAYLTGANLTGANLTGANLTGAYLSRTNLTDANLAGANLLNADLTDANLRRTNLSRTNLTDANLAGANLLNANLAGANLLNADLANCAGNRSQIKSIFVSDVYPITYTAESLQIGCENHLIKDWWGFDDDRIIAMDSDALVFWEANKEFIKSTIMCYPATKTNYKQEL